jgi:hypothetical protein
MKAQFHYFHLLPVLAAGLMISPLAAQSPDRPGPPPPGAPPREAPQPDRIQAAVRQMVELRQAGKPDEARAIARRLREAAKSNPEIAKQIAAAMNHPRPGARPDGRPGPARPNAAAAAQRGGERKPQVQPLMRPKAEAAKQAKVGKGEVANIRHLRQAAVHLAAAGFAQEADKARALADRMTAALKESRPQAQPDQPQRKPDRKPDVNAAILGELRKMGSQLGEISDRVRKLEAREDVGQ